MRHVGSILSMRQVGYPYIVYMFFLNNFCSLFTRYIYLYEITINIYVLYGWISPIPGDNPESAITCGVLVKWMSYCPAIYIVSVVMFGQWLNFDSK